MTLSLIILLPFLGSLVATFLPSNARGTAGWLSGIVAATCALLLVSLWPEVSVGEVIHTRVAWMPTYGLEFHLRADGFSWLFAMLVSGMGVLVVLYARYYMSAEDPVPRFFSFLMAFMGAMLGVVLSGNLIQLVAFWELTSLTSFVLIAYWYHREDARRGARMALIVTVGGGLCLLLGAVLLGHVVGSFDLDRVLASGDLIRAHPWYDALVVLIVIGVLTKSAQFPFHFWLPHAMAAPTPVSAYLHSATMVKAGVFLLARLWPALSGTQTWFWLVGCAGGATLLLGAVSATFQRDMKGVLAYSTISHLGLITLLLGMNSQLALVAAVFHMMNHATFKASLFMATGIVDHETGTRDLAKLGGLRNLMPITGVVATVSAGAMAGVPLLNGFLSKEMFFSESLVAGGTSGLRFTLPAVATLAGVFSVAYSLRFIHQVFFGEPSPEMPRKPHEPTRGMLLPSVVLVTLCVLVGVMPGRMVGPLLEDAAMSILGPALPHYELKVWHGFTVPLVMSFIALGGGVALYGWLVLRNRAMIRTPVLSRLNAARIFDLLNVLAIRGAGRLARKLYSTRLQTQLLAIVAAALVAGGLPLLAGGWTRGDLPLTPVDPRFALLWAAGAAAALAAAWQAKFHRLAALILVGVVGLLVCLTFAWFSAPDLALTQISVEVVTLVLILLGLRWLPRRLEMEDPRRSTARARLRRARDGTLSIAFGAAAAALAYAVLTRQPFGEIGPYFLANALELGGGRNVVNVILVDFRGFDTMGEITVVGMVAMIVFALLRRFRPPPESIEVPRAQRRDGEAIPTLSTATGLLPEGELRIPAVLTRLLLPMAGMVSLYFLLRGHNAPGGGFVGGLVFATAVIVQYMVGGTIWVETRLRVLPLYWMGFGLLSAAGAGALAFLSDEPFLTARTLDLHLPVIGDVHLSSVLLFDLGVYALVVGATLLILVALAHQSLRSPRRVVVEEAG